MSPILVWYIIQHANSVLEHDKLKKRNIEKMNDSEESQDGKTKDDSLYINLLNFIKPD